MLPPPLDPQGWTDPENGQMPKGCWEQQIDGVGGHLCDAGALHLEALDVPVAAGDGVVEAAGRVCRHMMQGRGPYPHPPNTSTFGRFFFVQNPATQSSNIKTPNCGKVFALEVFKKTERNCGKLREIDIGSVHISTGGDIEISPPRDLYCDSLIWDFHYATTVYVLKGFMK